VIESRLLRDLEIVGRKSKVGGFVAVCNMETRLYRIK